MNKNVAGIPDDYVPYGPEWEKQLMRFSKQALINMYKGYILSSKEEIEKLKDTIFKLTNYEDE